MTIRVRFAPSPTGFLHLGGLRTALFNYLFSKNTGGAFILRIEDTDKTRFNQDSLNDIYQSLDWAGIEYNEGPKMGGNFGPYIQSERLDLYHSMVDLLLKNNCAYRCYCSPELLQAKREEALKTGKIYVYDGTCRDKMVVSGKKDPHVVRFLSAKRPLKHQDLTYGAINFSGTSVAEDFVLLKRDGFPTYHLANVVDDHQMQISHVIRGEEWLPSVPKHLELYASFKWKTPLFSHLPLLLNKDRSKLSKRHGALAISAYRDEGYLAEAIVNFVALLGWHPPERVGNQEIFAISDLEKMFDLKDVNTSGAIVDNDKLLWINKQHLNAKSLETKGLEQLTRQLRKEATKMTGVVGKQIQDDEYMEKCITLCKERIHRTRDITQEFPYLFVAPHVEKSWCAENVKDIIMALEVLNQPLSTNQQVNQWIDEIRSKTAKSKGQVIQLLRMALTGQKVGPAFAEVVTLLGPGTCQERLERIIKSPQ